jgi:hypothetical protein
MASISRPEIEITELNREIERLQAERALLADQRRKRAKAAGRAAWRVRYLRLASLLRQPAAKMEWWRIAVLIAGPGLAGFLVAVLLVSVTPSATLALVGFLVGGGAAFAIAAALLFYPPDAQLPAAISAAESQVPVAAAHAREAIERWTEVEQRLAKLQEDRRTKIASGRVQRAALLQRLWKMMPSEEWADYVVEVCRTLGGTVDRRARVGELEELVVKFGDRSVAVLAISSRDAVNSEMVHQAVDLKSRTQSAACAIITNARVTGAAQDFAARNGCRIIGREEFPDFVVGAAVI